LHFIVLALQTTAVHTTIIIIAVSNYVSNCTLIVL